MTLCASVKPLTSALGAAPYQRTTGLPALAASRRPGFASESRRMPDWHAYAPKLDRAWPWSDVSAVSMRAIGMTMVNQRRGRVNAISGGGRRERSLRLLRLGSACAVDAACHAVVVRGVSICPASDPPPSNPDGHHSGGRGKSELPARGADAIPIR